MWMCCNPLNLEGDRNGIIHAGTAHSYPHFAASSAGIFLRFFFLFSLALYIAIFRVSATTFYFGGC